METYPLSELQERYIDNHQSLGRSHNTIYHYRDTFRLFGISLAEQRRATTSAALTTEIMREFATWIRNRPTERVRRGSTNRWEFGVHGVLKDMRAFVRWLTDEVYLTVAIRVPVPKLPQNLFPILTDEQLDRVWQSRYLVGKSGLAVRNRAMLGLMLYTTVDVPSSVLTISTQDQQGSTPGLRRSPRQQRRPGGGHSGHSLPQSKVRSLIGDPGSTCLLVLCGPQTMHSHPSSRRFRVTPETGSLRCVTLWQTPSIPITDWMHLIDRFHD